MNVTKATSQLNEPSHIEVKHIGTALLLLFIATIRPSGFFDFLTFSTALPTLLFIFLFLLYKVYHTIGFPNFFKRYKWEIGLIVIYEILCLLSIYINYSLYDGIDNVIKWGLALVVIQGAFFACLFLFSLPQQLNGLSFTRNKYANHVMFCALFFIAFVTILQFVDAETSFYLGQFFISSYYYDDLVNRIGIAPDEAVKLWSENAMSIFAIGTDLGSISALVTSILVLTLFSGFANRSMSTSLALICLVALYITAGMLSGSRNFVLTFSCFVLIFILIKLRNSLWQKLLLFVGLFLMVNCMLYFSPTEMAEKLSRLLPYLAPMAADECVPIETVTIVLNQNIFDARWDLWTRVVSRFFESPLLGVSNGGFRLTEGLHREIYNTHNIFLQIINDTGILGSITILCLGIVVFRRVSANEALHKPYLLTFCLLIVATNSVDFYIDHSLPWIIVATYCLSMSANIRVSNQQLERDRLSNKFIHSTVLFSILMTIFTVSYHITQVTDCYYP